jgi:ribosomal protein S27AE
MLEEPRYYKVVPRDLRAFEFLESIERDIGDEKGRLESLLKELIEIKERLESSGLRSMRLPCPHPLEYYYAIRILGDVDRDVFKSRTGFNSYAICLDCQHQFEGDFRDEKVNEWRFYYGCPSFEKAFRGKPEMKDERKCPRCGSSNVKTVFELINQTCPKCRKGIIEEIETGMIA